MNKDLGLDFFLDKQFFNRVHFDTNAAEDEKDQKWVNYLDFAKDILNKYNVSLDEKPKKRDSELLDDEEFKKFYGVH